MATLQSKALNGGFILVGRQFFGIMLSLIGMMVTTRLLGPHRYGQFAIVSGLAGYAIGVGKLGLDVYLIRCQGDLDQERVGVTQCLYLGMGLLFSVLIIIAGPVVGWLYKDDFLRTLMWSYAVITPVTLMSGVPMALLDRRLRYKEAAMTELVGQLVYCALSVSIVYLTHTAWGLIAGIFGQALTTLALACYWSRMKFAPCWVPDEARKQVRYGFGYSASMWIWQIRDLVNPLLVGKLLGAEAVAFIAMGLRLAALVGFAKAAVWRVYMSYLARLADDRQKMQQAIEDGLSHQVLVTGLSFVTFLAVAPELIQGLVGLKWLPVLQVFPFIAVGAIVNSGFSLYSSALYIVGRNKDVSLFHAVHIVLFACCNWLLLTRMGSIASYGWAEVAALLSYLWIRGAFRKALFPIRENHMYGNILLFCFGVMLMTQLQLGPLWVRLACLALFVALTLFALPLNRTNSLQLIGMARQKLSAGRA
jgi:O-antigen/teichoic acid export membrane protein